MAEENKSGNFSLPSAGAMAVILSLVGYFLIGPSAFIDERPNTPESVDSRAGVVQDIDARLWQDPFAAIKKDVEKSSSKKAVLNLSQKESGKKIDVTIADKEETEPNDHSLARISQAKISDTATGVTVIAAMVSAGPYSEQQEMRIRRRYALVSALSTRHYKPRDSQHIGYFRPDKNGVVLPEAIPFEWFEPQTGNDRRILVLWIDDSRFGEKPIAKKFEEIFRQISSVLERKTHMPLQYRVIGPNDSGQLRELVGEKKQKLANEAISEEKFDIRFYSAAATAEERRILDEAPGGNLEKIFDHKLVRTVSGDDKLAKALVDELKLRHIDPENDHVVLLSEWDTLYGRSLPLTFTSAYTHSAVLLEDCDSSSLVHCYGYVRGIDGKLPGNSSNEEKKNDPQAKPDEKNSPDIYPHPDGLSQKDYLRRLVNEIRELDHKIIDKDGCFDSSRRCGVSAIGVLGYDVYDKLAILQALRPYFPGKLFFTTELDALYSSPKELPFTKNMVVASSFGLGLRPEIQKGIPPFRDSYQTSFFLATLLALSNDIKDIPYTVGTWLEKPRIFEIGKSGPVDLSGKEYNRDCRRPSECYAIHPDSIWERPHDQLTKYRWWLFILSVILLTRVSWGFRKFIWEYLLGFEVKDTPKLHKENTNESARSSNNEYNMALYFRIKKCITIALEKSRTWDILKNDQLFISLRRIVLVFFFPIALWGIFYYFNDDQGEPWLWADGISIWPSEILRLVAFMLSIFFLAIMEKKIVECDEKLVEKFKLPSGEELKERQTKCRGFFRGAGSISGWEVLEKQSVVDVKQIWREYKERGIFHARLSRSVVNLLFFCFFAYAAVILSGGLPTSARGDLVLKVDAVMSLLAGISTVWLTMMVVDASRLCDRFITHLDGDGKPSDWACADNFVSDWGISRDYVVYWIDVKFVAKLSKAIELFIWYPVPPLLLLVAARSSIFDNSVFSYGLAISFLVLLCYLFSCAYVLQRGAKKMRGKAVRELGKKLRVLRADPKKNEKDIALVERMVGEIDNIKEGAFTPFMQQPMVRAIVAMASGGGIIPLLEGTLLK